MTFKSFLHHSSVNRSTFVTKFTLEAEFYTFNLSFALYIVLMRFVYIFVHIRTNIEPLSLGTLNI